MGFQDNEWKTSTAFAVIKSPLNQLYFSFGDL